MKKYNSYLAALLAGSTLSVFGSISSASAYTVYTKYSDWKQAVSGSPITFEDFSNTQFASRKQVLPFSTGIVSTGYNGTRDNVIFAGNSWAVNVASDIGVDGYVYQGWLEKPNLDRVTYPTKYPIDYYNSITWVFPTAVKGFFGTFLDTANGPGLVLTLKYNDNTSEVIDFYNLIKVVNANSTRPRDKSPGDVIFGITGKAFKSMTFTTRPVSSNPNYEEGWMVDNFSFAAVSGTTSLLSRAATTIAVPEPFTILGTGTAIIFGTLFKRTNRQKKSKTS
ncbi:PEP-CTERM sorting domain-containing protein [Gloeothece verrucosa]|uniref:PEP-CTERM protein-sorting domain-containing protein n=1 Tax=Gloeothece verrucosa (strain PCC 7822) TaxID=497965 RepID=E0UL47_GLOV7|nr:PEP-CTERM sorting domain-containing protein [Gloeothece verrucosa]ADN17677.1 hypothetical protein Cyan7822_5823 [Gloeothece verrucosa PCC 7822]